MAKASTKKASTKAAGKSGTKSAKSNSSARAAKPAKSARSSTASAKVIGTNSKPSSKDNSTKAGAKPAARPATPPAAKTRAAGNPLSPRSERNPAVVARSDGTPDGARLRKGKKKRKRDNTPLPPVIPPVTAVPTENRPRKNQAGLNVKELEHFRDLLLAKRRELVGDMSSMEREALRSSSGSNLSNLPLHMADMGTDNYEQEFTLGLMEKDRKLLRDINQALAKIQDGTYGLCEGTGKPIGKPRLEVQPWARFSIEYARQLERGMMIRQTP